MSVFLFLAALLQAPADLGAPPVEKRPACACKEAPSEDLILVRGFPIDGELRLDEKTGRDPLPRQATVFRVLNAKGVEAKTPFKIWHKTDDACGVAFDYGKYYVVGLRKNGEEYETDRCLLEAAAKAGKTN